MATDFSTKTFLRNVSPKLLQQFFKNRQPLGDFDWTLDGDALVEAVYQAIDRLPKESKGYVVQAFETCHDLADEEGILALFGIIETLYGEKAEEVLEQLMKNKGPHEQVLWLLLHHERVLEWAMRLDRMEAMKFKSECLVGEHPDVSTGQDTKDALQELLQKIYKKQRRGGNCQIDAYVRENPKRYCFFAYPEDYAKKELLYKGRQLTTGLRWPVMEHVFIYEPDCGKLRISAGRMHDVTPLQEAFCKAVLELEGIPDGSTKVYDLQLLMKPEFRFTDNTDRPIEYASLRMLKAAVKNDFARNRRLACEGEPENGGAEYVRTMMSKAALAIGVSAEKLIITSAKITIYFKKPEGGRKPVTFVLTCKGGSTLEEKPYHHLAAEYLEEWGLAKLLFAKEDEAA